MLLRVSICLNGLVFILLVPLLEIGPTHVFNSDWPAHARLHEVWQLVTNALLSILAIGLVHKKNFSGIAAAICLTINIGFLTALAIADTYGGGMKHSDGSELLVAGVNPASAIILALSFTLIGGLVRTRKADAINQ